ncbi:MAG: VIT1/CCC1 transporter family protein [Candidatus Lokiarchaeota archaeon]|nr:VIT1/CCC1 transporter family protein [Candidatus Lokiarchaeota archaeon]
MIDKVKTYANITDFLSIARRYFVNNFYDGILTVLGIILGFFISILRGNQLTINSYLVLLTGFATSISMLVSGLSGSYISEKAELRKLKLELDKAMVLVEEEQKNEEDIKVENEEIEKAMITINLNRKNERKKRGVKNPKSKKKKVKTIQEKAERFASIVVSLVNGCAPFLGGIIPLIPFFLTENSGFDTFIYSFLIIFVCIVLLGSFVGFISQESILKNILQMLAAFGITMLISILLLN